jgi:hypothetical protein
MTPTSLYRLAALGGLLSGLVLLVNTARRAGALPSDGFTYGIAPLSATLAIFALTGLYLWQRQQTGVVGLIGYACNAAGLAGLVGGEYVLNYVFPQLPAATISTVLAGPFGRFIVLTTLVAVVGALVFSVATWRGGVLPRPAAVVYAVGFTSLGFRQTLPVSLSTVGLLVAVVGTAWLSAALWQAASRAGAADALVPSARPTFP